MTCSPPSSATVVVVGFVGSAEPDVGAATGHLGGHRHRSERARLGDDGGLLGVVLRVEHDCGYAGLDQPLVQLLGFGDVAGADEHRLTGLVHLDDVLDDRVVLWRRP